jgi:hypothetical protein
VCLLRTTDRGSPPLDTDSDSDDPLAAAAALIAQLDAARIFEGDDTDTDVDL